VHQITKLLRTTRLDTPACSWQRVAGTRSTGRRPLKRRCDEVVTVIRERIARGLGSGALESGDALPSARLLARELDVDPRLVLAAYAQLAEENLVRVRPRSGVYVGTHAAVGGQHAGPPRRWLLDVLAQGIAHDLTAEQLTEHIREILGSARATVVECNTDQIHAMCHELRRDYSVEASGVELGELEAVESEARLPLAIRHATLIVSASHEPEVRRIAQLAGKPYVITRVRPELLERFGRLLLKGAVYFLVSDPRFARKLRRLVAPMPGSANFHALVVGEDDLRVIPRGAPTYLMRSASERLGNELPRGRLIPALRIFAPDTVREILTLVLAPSGRGACGGGG
jgi:DNA-binding transcriptional regulator YhcF (GntR family)